MKSRSGICSLGWHEFFEKVKREFLMEEEKEGKKCDDGYYYKRYIFKERIELLKEVRKYFKKNEHFSDMELEQRKNIAGTTKAGDRDWGWFGKMWPSGTFKTIIKGEEKYTLKALNNISEALDKIPLNGPVSEENYKDYVKLYMKTWKGMKAWEAGKAGKAQGNSSNPIGTATRLLALKRPDTFLCINNENRGHFCRDFGIKKGSLNVDNYWEEVVERICCIQRCILWREEKQPPKDPEERAAWNARAALLDAIYYDETDTP